MILMFLITNISPKIGFHPPLIMKMENQPNKEKCEGNKYCEQLVARIKELTKREQRTLESVM